MILFVDKDTTLFRSSSICYRGWLYFEEQLLTTLKTRLPDRKRYSREVGEDGDRAVFRCTLLPPDKKLLRGSGFPELLDELLGIIKL